MVKTETRTNPDPVVTRPAQATTGDALDAKIAPLDEFRSRAESWMKEITAQVARLAGRSEDEERRKGALDKRLADIEGRMQSLLTLTEMVSMSKNPFAGNRDARGPAAETASIVQERAPTKAPTPAPKPTNPTPQAEAGDERTPVARAHPNDAHAEAVPAAAPIAPPPITATFPRRQEAPEPRRHTPAQERFFVLEWARLLAPAAMRVDLGGFLGFYVEAGWVTPDVASTVRNLTLQLCREADADAPALPLDQLHARSILLVSRLNGSGAAVNDARVALREAREAATGDWAVLER